MWYIKSRSSQLKSTRYNTIFFHEYSLYIYTWWRHQVETFFASLAICEWNSPAPSKFPTQRPVTRSFDVSFDLRQNKRLCEQWWGWWFETPLRHLWRHCNVYIPYRVHLEHTKDFLRLASPLRSLEKKKGGGGFSNGEGEPRGVFCLLWVQSPLIFYVRQ